MNSNLPNILHFAESDINWEECDKFATSSRVFEACNYWNNGIHNTKEIASKMKMHRNTIQRYIRKGRKLGLIQE